MSQLKISASACIVFLSLVRMYVSFLCLVIVGLWPSPVLFFLVPLFTISFLVFCLKCSGIYKPLTSVSVWNDVHL